MITLRHSLAETSAESGKIWYEFTSFLMSFEGGYPIIPNILFYN
jgi:hypothetical protein